MLDISTILWYNGYSKIRWKEGAFMDSIEFENLSPEVLNYINALQKENADLGVFLWYEI